MTQQEVIAPASLPQELFINSDADITIDVLLKNSELPARPSVDNATYREIGVLPNKIHTETYDPTPIVAGATLTKSVTMLGISNFVNVGDPVVASFSVYDANIEISATVSAANTVTVKFKNIGASAVDLTSGMLSIKKV